MAQPAPPADFAMADWLVEPALCRISGAGRSAHLRPKLMDLLVFLASRQGRVVGKAELLSQVWHGEFVVGSVLGRSVADLRHLLGDDAGSPRFIETIPRRSYRLIAPVCWTDAIDHGPVEPSIAVLPFAAIGAGPDQQYFCDGLAEEVTNTLCGVEGLRVVARTSAFACRDRRMDVREIGRQLGVSSMLEGAVQRADGRLRITVQLVNAADGSHAWSRRFDRPAGDAFAIQDDITQAVTAELRVTLLGGEGLPVHRHASDPEAHDLYLKGRYFSARRTTDALTAAAACFEAAIARAPGYALAHAALAECCGVGAFYGHLPPADAYRKALAVARRAVELEPRLAEGHAVLATCTMFRDWLWTEAEQGFRCAIGLSPNYALARMWYSHLLAATTRHDEAMAQAEHARRLDPWSPTVRLSVGMRLAEAGRFEDAIQLYRATLAMEPDYGEAHFHLGRTFAAMGRYEEALAHLQRLRPGPPIVLGYVGHVLGRLGGRREAADILEELTRLSAERHVGALPFALVHHGLGELDAALDWYGKAFEARESVLAFAEVDPIYDTLRPDPRFAALLERLQVPG